MTKHLGRFTIQGGIFGKKVYYRFSGKNYRISKELIKEVLGKINDKITGRCERLIRGYGVWVLDVNIAVGCQRIDIKHFEKVVEELI